MLTLSVTLFLIAVLNKLHKAYVFWLFLRIKKSNFFNALSKK